MRTLNPSWVMLRIAQDAAHCAETGEMGNSACLLSEFILIGARGQS
jgi:hypothetical protein